MERNLGLFIPAILLFGCTHVVKPTGKQILNNLQSCYSRHKSIRYHINYSIKPFDKDTPYKYNADCKLVRYENDTLLHACLYLKLKDSGKAAPEKWYDLKSSYVVWDSAKEITEYDDPKYARSAINGDFAGGIKDIYFIQPQKIADDITRDTTTKDMLSTESLENEECWKISVKYPDQQGFTELRTVFWISKKDTVLKKMQDHVQLKDQEQITEWEISSATFDNVTCDGLELVLKNKLATYKTNHYVPPAQVKMLEQGSKAPAFSGLNFNAGKTYNLNDCRGKVVLLDFWYMGCYWCIKEMPAIEKINEKYKSKGLVVLGINRFDTSAKAKARLPVFLRDNKINYPTIITSYKTDSAYKVSAYPTLYLIGKDGHIAFLQKAFIKNMDSVLDDKISEALNK